MISMMEIIETCSVCKREFLIENESMRRRFFTIREDKMTCCFCSQATRKLKVIKCVVCGEQINPTGIKGRRTNIRYCGLFCQNSAIDKQREQRDLFLTEAEIMVEEMKKSGILEYLIIKERKDRLKTLKKKNMNISDERYKQAFAMFDFSNIPKRYIKI